MARQSKQAQAAAQQTEAEARAALIQAACVAALNLQAARHQVKTGKDTLTSMADRLKAAGVTTEVVKAAREVFGATAVSILGLPPVERSKQVASTDATVRALVAGMLAAAGIDKARWEAADTSEKRKAMTATPVKALQRLAPATPKASTKPADIYEAAQSWGERMRKEFESFKPKAINSPEFKRFAQVLFDSLTMEASE